MKYTKLILPSALLRPDAPIIHHCFAERNLVGTVAELGDRAAEDVRLLSLVRACVSSCKAVLLTSPERRVGRAVPLELVRPGLVEAVLIGRARQPAAARLHQQIGIYRRDLLPPGHQCQQASTPCGSRRRDRVVEQVGPGTERASVSLHTPTNSPSRPVTRVELLNAVVELLREGIRVHDLDGGRERPLGEVLAQAGIDERCAPAVSQIRPASLVAIAPGDEGHPGERAVLDHVVRRGGDKVAVDRRPERVSPRVLKLGAGHLDLRGEQVFSGQSLEARKRALGAVAPSELNQPVVRLLVNGLIAEPAQRRDRAGLHDLPSALYLSWNAPRRGTDPGSHSA
ncbi:unnamed protein product [Cutaneotrichosporon oleaginosum]